MMIKVELEVRHPQGLPDIFCPVFICDYCGRKIDRIGMGIYHYRADKKGYPLDKSIEIYHKGSCHDSAEAKEFEETGEILWSWLELRDLIGFLANNTGLKWTKLIEEYCPDEELRDVQYIIKKRIADAKKEE
jgi:hypothetical protein